ncbi:MAG: hypothetical protein ABWZ63_06040 [Thermoleophilaceae bacterium]
MNPSSPVDRERRLAMPVALAAFAAVAAFILAIIVNQGSDVTGADTDPQFLTRFDEESGTLLLGTILQAAGMVLVIAPLFYLFQAAAARSDTVRPALVGITVAGPLFLAVGTVLQWVAFDHAASEFASTGGGLGVPVGEYAEDLIKDQGAYDASQGFTFAGTLGFVVAVAYTALHAMRTGLLTRFWGTLGMALGVSLLFLGFVGVLVFILALGILFAGWWPGGRPSAWEAGKAVPWPRPGEEPAEERPPEPADESAEPAGAGSQTAQPGSGPPPRKRKRRRDG